MRWMLALFGRITLFWGIWIALIALAACGLSRQGLNVQVWGRVARVAWFVAVAVLLMRETSRLNVALFNLQGALTAAGRKVPPRLHSMLRGGAPLGLLALAWTAVLELFSPWIAQLREEGGAAHAAAMVGAFAWSFATLLVLGLALGGLSLLWFRVAARGVPAGRRPAIKPVLPWTVACWSAACLPLALFGLPDLSVPGDSSSGGSASEAGWSGTGPTYAPPATSSPPVELLLRPAPGVDPVGVNSAIKLADARLARAVPSAAEGSDAVLASTYVVSVPADYATPLALFLTADAGEVAHVEFNSTVKADATPVRECAPASTSFPADDPHGGDGLTDFGLDSALLQLSSMTAGGIAVIGIVDTGVDGGHRDLSGTLLGDSGWSDGDGHGTATAGAAGAIANNRRGIASFNLGGSFIHLRSYPALGIRRDNADDIAAAVKSATDEGVNVLNLSFGARGAAPEVVAASIRRALERGVVVV